LPTMDARMDGRGARQAGADVIASKKSRERTMVARPVAEPGRGFSAAIAIDADGQHDADDIPSSSRPTAISPEAIITGSRMGDPDRIHAAGATHVPCRSSSRWLRTSSSEDTQCGSPVSLATIASLRSGKSGRTETRSWSRRETRGRVRSLPIKPSIRPASQPTSDHPRRCRYLVLVISYLMVKWGIEAVRPGAVNSTGGREPAGMCSACLPGSIFFSSVWRCWRACPEPLCISCGTSRPVACRSGRPQHGVERAFPGRVAAIDLLLPVLLAVAVIDVAVGRLSVDLDWTSRFFRRHYAMRWRVRSRAAETAPSTGTHLTARTPAETPRRRGDFGAREIRIALKVLRYGSAGPLPHRRFLVARMSRRWRVPVVAGPRRPRPSRRR